jgi:hypothetical protein
MGPVSMKLIESGIEENFSFRNFETFPPPFFLFLVAHKKVFSESGLTV